MKFRDDVLYYIVSDSRYIAQNTSIFKSLELTDSKLVKLASDKTDVRCVDHGLPFDTKVESIKKSFANIEFCGTVLSNEEIYEISTNSVYGTPFKDNYIVALFKPDMTKFKYIAILSTSLSNKELFGLGQKYKSRDVYLEPLNWNVFEILHYTEKYTDLHGRDLEYTFYAKGKCNLGFLEKSMLSKLPVNPNRLQCYLPRIESAIQQINKCVELKELKQVTKRSILKLEHDVVISKCIRFLIESLSIALFVLLPIFMILCYAFLGAQMRNIYANLSFTNHFLYVYATYLFVTAVLINMSFKYKQFN
ncbi:MAG: hypothetical protein ACRDD8_10575 [Bacteroidales bacterium]